MHQIKVLARKANISLESEIGVSILEVDYSNVNALAKVLEQNSIDTVISAMNTLPSASESSEINLIYAASASNCTRRFVPRKTGAFPTKKKFTVFYNGFFLDYYGIPSIQTYLPPSVAMVDLAYNTSTIPGSSDTPVVFTHTTDVAKYVAASLELEKWDEEGYRLLKALPPLGTKFNVVYDSIEKLRSGTVTELPSHAAAFAYMPKDVFLGLFSATELLFADDSFDLKPETTMNEKFPKIKPFKVKDVLTPHP
ncbi:hypothetical protein B7463_g11671, partial [Scytalidium lignicola]